MKLDIKIREFDMTQTRKALALAATMIGISVLAVFEIVPQETAEWAPLGLLALFQPTLAGLSQCSGGAA